MTAVHSSSEAFATAVSGERPITLRVEHVTAGVLAEGRLEQPFGIIGGEPECDIALNDPTLPSHVAAFQVIDGQLLIFPFDTHSPHHLHASAPWSFGRYTLTYPDSAPTQPVPNLNQIPNDWKKITLELQNGRAVSKSWTLTQRMVFIGGAKHNTIHLDSVDVAAVHAYFLLAQDELWLVDLQSLTGTWHNGKRVRVAKVFDGDDVRIGSFRIACRFDLWGHIAVREPALDPAAHQLVALSLAPPVMAEANPAAQFMQMLAASQEQMLAKFQESMQQMLMGFAQTQQVQMASFQHEVTRLAELNLELQKLYQLQQVPLSPPATALPLFSPLPEPDTLPPMNEDTANSHHWMATRMSDLIAERSKLWNRVKGLFGSTLPRY